MGLLLLTVTDVSTTCAVVIFRVKVSCITSVDGIRLNHSPPCWMQRHHFSYESEATRVKTIMVESMSTSTSSEFCHRNLVDIPLFTSAFIDKMASENLPVKVTMTRGYKFFHESYIHDVEGKLPDVTALSVIAR